MSDYFDRIADEWRSRAAELAEWSMTHLVNRTDVWGRYLSKRQRKGEFGAKNSAITAPFREERGKVFLNVTSLEKHFKTRDVGGVLGLHSTSSDLTSRWLAIDIDLHDEDDLSVSPQGNFVAAHHWYEQIVAQGGDPLLLDSNGKGGFHLLLLLAAPMETASVHAFGKKLTEDFERRGLDRQPEIFPGSPKWDHHGDWLRLLGRHHTRDHYTRVWNDEPWAEEQRWLEGCDAIDRVLRTAPLPIETAESLGLRPARRTICLDFDGVIHSYRSGWCGSEVIPDPPIHGVQQAIARLRQRYRVVVHSARCATDAGHEAVKAWLVKHGVEVDDVCRFKPPATVYVDDRAVPFRGDWLQTITDIHDFRK
ncbi:MAG: hypothetical protein RIC55_25615 [Pirellulaceae bacterium]